MKQKTNSRLLVVLPWVLTIAVLAVSTVIVSTYREGVNPFQAQLDKEKLLSTMNIHLLEAIEAEKNAVMAMTDEASEQFAAQARKAVKQVDSGTKDVEAILRREKIPRETAMLTEFNGCWSQYKKLDESILNLATQNSNFKAQKLSATQCAEQMTRFEDSLQRLIQRGARDSQCHKAILQAAYEALTAGLKIYSLHKAHIEEADDPAMDRIEQRIKVYDATARQALASLHGIAELGNAEDLKGAEAAYDGFMASTGEVLKLSRMNTNIKSAELSLGKKRLVASQCREILATLHTAVQTQGNYSLPRSKVKNIAQ